MRRAVVVLGLLGAACDKQKAPAPAAATSATPVSPKRDPAIMAAATKAIACPFQQTGIDSGCADFEAYRESLDKVEASVGRATFVSMVEDGNEKLRWLGALSLIAAGKGYEKDKALGSRSPPITRPRRRSRSSSARRSVAWRVFRRASRSSRRAIRC